MQLANSTPERKAAMSEHARTKFSHDSETQRLRSLARWAKPDALENVGPCTDERKKKTSSSMKNFWANKTPEERRAIALSNWAKRRAKVNS